MSRVGSSNSFANQQLYTQQREAQRSATRAGAMIPEQMNAPKTGTQVRITPENYRQVLGANADVLLTPADLRQLYEQGHLDVQRQFQVAESNEGFLTLTAKFAAALVGPSRSVGAISIDPLFLEMIKDPNAKVGAGYTRVQSETLTVLPSPARPEPTPPSTIPENPEPTVVPQNTTITPAEETEEAANERAEYRELEEERVEQGRREYVVQTTTGDGKAVGSWEGANDSTLSGAYNEALLQDRDLAAAHQHIQRFSLDLNSLISAAQGGQGDKTKLFSRLRGNLNSVVPPLSEAVKQQLISKVENALVFKVDKDGKRALDDQGRAIVQSVNQEGLRELINSRTSLLNNVAKEASHGQFPNFAASSAVERHGQDFRAIAYVSKTNATKSTTHIAGISTDSANAILKKQATGVFVRDDGSTKHFDTLNILATRQVKPHGSDPGYEMYAQQYPEANTLADVYRLQTENTPIPLDNTTVNTYVNLYNQRFPQNPITADSVKAAPPTLMDMYALRAANFTNTISVRANNGKVEIAGDPAQVERSKKLVMNVRLVLEANTPGLVTHSFDQTSVQQVNKRAEHNFKGVTIGLENNSDQAISQTKGYEGLTPEQQTLQRVQLYDINNDRGIEADIDKTDTDRFNANNSGRNLQQVGYGFRGVEGSGGTTTTTRLDPEKTKTTISDNIHALNKENTILGENDEDNQNVSGIDAQIQRMERAGISLDQDIAPPIIITVPDPEDSTKQIQRPAQYSDWGTATAPGPLRNQVIATATTNTSTSDLVSKIDKNISDLRALGPNPAGIDPASVANFRDVLDRQISKLEGQSPEHPQLQSFKDARAELFGEGGPLAQIAAAGDSQRLLAATEGEGAPTDGPAAPTSGPGYDSEFVGKVDKSLDDFHKYVKGAIADGRISNTERNEMRQFVDTAKANTQRFISGIDASIGDVYSLPADQLKQKLLAKGVSEADADQIVSNVDRIKSINAAVNVASEGQAASSLYQSVRQLSQRLDQFESIEVAKTAFKDQMKGIAETDPDAFRTLMQVTYSLPPYNNPEGAPPRTAEQDAAIKSAYAELETKAKEGNMPFPPQVEFVPRSELAGGNGAYVREPGQDRPEQGKIYLADDLVQQPDKLLRVFSEEMFHHLEHQDGVQSLLKEKAASEGRTDDVAAANAGRDLDAIDDEGRRGLTALRQILAGNKAPDQLTSLADTAGREKANLTNNQGQIHIEDDADHGELTGTSNLGSVGSRIEFSTDPGATPQEVPEGTPRVVGGGTTNYNNAVGVDLDITPTAPYQSRPMQEDYDRGLTTPDGFNENYPQVDRLNNPDASWTAEEPGFWQKLGDGIVQTGGQLMEGLPSGLQALGLKIQQHGEKMQALVKQLFGEVANRLGEYSTEAHKTIYGEGGYHGNDVDASRGRAQNYEAQRNNHTARSLGAAAEADYSNLGPRYKDKEGRDIQSQRVAQAHSDYQKRQSSFFGNAGSELSQARGQGTASALENQGEYAMRTQAPRRHA